MQSKNSAARTKSIALYAVTAVTKRSLHLPMFLLAGQATVVRRQASTAQHQGPLFSAVGTHCEIWVVKAFWRGGPVLRSIFLQLSIQMINNFDSEMAGSFASISHSTTDLECQEDIMDSCEHYQILKTIRFDANSMQTCSLGHPNHQID